MSTHNKKSKRTPAGQPPNSQVPDSSLTLKEFLDTATDASRRTRFITIVLVVASVLLLVSVLNSAPVGWITLRLKALKDPASKYTLEQFPLLCACDPRSQKSEAFCKDKMTKPEFQMINDANEKVARLETALNPQAPQGVAAQGWGAAEPPDAAPAPIARELEAARAKRDEICLEEKKRLTTFHDTLLRSAAETKYTVRVPFFGVALDINDVGLLGGFSLWIILIMLRLSLRNQIVSLRVGFKAARASNRERWFYELLAARQVFSFPYLEDVGQRALVARGWTEAFWKKCLNWFSKLLWGWPVSILKWLSGLPKVVKRGLDKRLTPDYLHLLEEEQRLQGSVQGKDVWRVNRSTPLRIVPKLLCLLPFVIYSLQFWFDYKTQNYGNYLDEWRTAWLFRTDLFFLLNTFVFGLWCIGKWNELDKLWDYFDYESRVGRLP